MNKTELVAAIAEKSKLTKKDSENALNAALETISAALQNGDKVQLIGFGSFETKKRAARAGRNPKTMATIEIPASTYPTFKAGKALKDQIDKAK
ncbi:MAG: HU family DNA-binding protein [Clostridiaceae bacterium]|nr:HU family DNA-binding protein [Clostridiaceae bacterium]